MNRWTEKNLLGLRDQGKIKGYRVFDTITTPARQQLQALVGDRNKSKALIWMDLNLQLWSNEHALTLEMEYRFCQDRGWRFDYCWPAIKVAVEFNGGIFMQKSGHSNVKGLHRDSEKINRAIVEGWRVLQVTALNYTTVLKTLNEIVK